MIKIITDTCCSLVDKITEKNELYTFEPVSIGVTVEDTDYFDTYVDNKYEDHEDFLDILKNSPTAPRSFAPSPEAFYNAISSDDSEVVFIITVSSVLSATYSSANLAKTMYEDENNDKKIFVIDSKSGMTGQTAIVLNIINDIENGKDPKSIYDNALHFAYNELKIYLVLKSLNNLEKNGRIKPSIAKLATIMNMRPICTAVNGEFALVHKPRGDKAYKKLIELVKNHEIDYSNRVLTISHVNNLEVATMVKEEISKFANFKDILIINDLTYLGIMYCENGGITISY